VIFSLGSWSAPFLRPYGIRLNIYPAKGYSVTIPTEGANRAPVTSLTDDEFKLVYSNFGDRLRVAGTAELSGYSRALNRTRCQAILDNVKKLFPRAGRFEAATFWSGLRPRRRRTCLTWAARAIAICGSTRATGLRFSHCGDDRRWRGAGGGVIRRPARPREGADPAVTVHAERSSWIPACGGNERRCGRV
jgi:hypothetical protein